MTSWFGLRLLSPASEYEGLFASAGFPTDQCAYGGDGVREQKQRHAGSRMKPWRQNRIRQSEKCPHSLRRRQRLKRASGRAILLKQRRACAAPLWMFIWRLIHQQQIATRHEQITHSGLRASVVYVKKVLPGETTRTIWEDQARRIALPLTKKGRHVHMGGDRQRLRPLKGLALR